MAADFNKMAKEREAFAATLEDSEIYRSIVLKVLQLEVDLDMKVGLLIDAIKDVGTIFGNLRYFNKKGILPNKDYSELLAIFVEKYEESRSFIEFDPTKYTEE